MEEEVGSLRVKGLCGGMGRGRGVRDSLVGDGRGRRSGRLAKEKGVRQHMQYQRSLDGLEGRELTCIKLETSLSFEIPLDVEIDLVEVGTNKIRCQT